MKQLAGQEPPCGACDKPDLSPENIDVIVLLSTYGLSFFDGNGGLNTHAIEYILNKCVEEEFHLEMYQKITNYCIARRKFDMEEQERKTKNTIKPQIRR